MFESILSKEHFDVHFTSKNQTYFYVTAKKIGKTQLTSKLDSIMVSTVLHLTGHVVEFLFYVVKSLRICVIQGHVLSTLKLRML